MPYESGQSDLAYLKDEGATPGTLIVPAGTDGMRLIADADVSQNKMTAESLERVNSLSITDLLSLRYEPGKFKLSFYMKRTGTVDTAVPSLDTVFTNAFGIKATSAGVHILYSLLTIATTLKNFSLFNRKGSVGLQCNGSFINDLSLNVQADPSEGAIFRGEASGEFYQMRWVVPTVTTEAASVTDAGLVKIKVAAADLSPSDHATVAVVIAGKFTIGSYIKVGALTTSHKITGINPTTGVITFAPALGSDQISGSAVAPYFPTESEVGDPISGHKGIVTFDGANQPTILQAGFKMTLPRRCLVEEKNGEDYPSHDAIEGKRRITVDPIRAYYNPTTHPNWHALAHMLSQKALVIPVGDVTGYKWQLSVPQAIVQEPNLVGSGIVELGTKMLGVASASLDDEASLKSF